ncbi:MAG: type I methionyl aminopeptidase [Rickettsiales bacterium]|jgi:methionyl aminopeptidase|nr:type I methionyl aminopeptidase [Rickettsiales bacterium]
MHNITIHKPEDFSKMRISGKLAAEVLDFITDYVKPGVTTLELNDLCHDMIIKNGAIPAPLNYRGFPKSICTSINHVVCHGIPDDRKLKDGDIINIDVTVIVDGWHGDSSRTYYVGKPSVKAKRLVETTHEAMMRGIEQVKPGAHLSDIGHAIESYIKPFGYSSVREYCGHGIGRIFHTEPSVMHFGKAGTGPVLEEGMFFTVEPMINVGTYQTRLSPVDNWTVTTKDRQLSAQFEHTIGVTSNGYEIFTLSPKGYDKPPYNN